MASQDVASGFVCFGHTPRLSIKKLGIKKCFRWYRQHDAETETEMEAAVREEKLRLADTAWKSAA
jgi:hypothetical protein